MKKYTVFILSFLLLYVIAQVISGWVLTALYTPDLSAMNTTDLNQEVTIVGQGSVLTIVITLLVATIAYVISQKVKTD